MAENKRLKFLIDIGHPGHVHLFRPFAQCMQKKGNIVLFTCRQKEFEIELLEADGFKYINFGKHYKTIIGKIWGLIKFNIQMLNTAIRFKPNFFLSHGSLYAAQIAWILGKVHISFEDTGNMEQIRLYLPFTKAVLTSTAFHKNLGKKQIKYSSYHELAYLHPKYFKPVISGWEFLNLEINTPYIILRFVSWNASHDDGQSGLSLLEKRELVSLLEQRFRVFISSENELPDFLKKYKINISPDKIHVVLRDAKLFIGEGATMASECAVLGTPAIYINTLVAGTINEQQEYGLLTHLKSGKDIKNVVENIISKENFKRDYQSKRDKLLESKISLTDFFIWFIENWPESFIIMKENPDYQSRFK